MNSSSSREKANNHKIIPNTNSSKSNRYTISKTITKQFQTKHASPNNKAFCAVLTKNPIRPKAIIKGFFSESSNNDTKWNERSVKCSSFISLNSERKVVEPSNILTSLEYQSKPIINLSPNSNVRLIKLNNKFASKNGDSNKLRKSIEKGNNTNQLIKTLKIENGIVLENKENTQKSVHNLIDKRNFNTIELDSNRRINNYQSMFCLLNSNISQLKHALQSIEIRDDKQYKTGDNKDLLKEIEKSISFVNTSSLLNEKINVNLPVSKINSVKKPSKLILVDKKPDKQINLNNSKMK